MGIDIYREGSGNPGTSNVFRTLGKGPAALVLLGDGAKGALAAALAVAWVGETAGFAAVALAVLGHAFPLWHRFRGGKGVATAIGGLIFLAPAVGVLLAVLWLVVVLVGKVASVASLVAMALYLPGLALVGRRGAVLGWAAAIVVLVVARHASNIRRMWRGAERRLDSG